MALCLETGYTSLNKTSEELCGDRVECTVCGDYTTLVLADGLGSGVKANILSTLTSKILCTMVSNDVDIEDCVETILQSLPVCKVRGVAYSTFSVIHVNGKGEGVLFEFDNPQAILIRGEKCSDLPREAMNILGKTVYKSPLALQKDDVIVVMSDGVIHAGIGMTLNLGWQRPEVKDFLDRTVKKGMSARAVACLLAGVCNDLYLDKPGDDTTVAAVRIREALNVNIMSARPWTRKKTILYRPLFVGRREKGGLRRHEFADRGAPFKDGSAREFRFSRQGRSAHRLYRGHRPHHRGRSHSAQALGTFGKIPVGQRSDAQEMYQKGRRVAPRERAVRRGDERAFFRGAEHQRGASGAAHRHHHEVEIGRVARRKPEKNGKNRGG